MCKISRACIASLFSKLRNEICLYAEYWYKCVSRAIVEYSNDYCDVFISIPSRSIACKMKFRTYHRVWISMGSAMVLCVGGALFTFASGARSIATKPSVSFLSVSAPALSSATAVSPDRMISGQYKLDGER